MTGTTVVLARHGRTPWHRPNRYTGSSDVPIDEFGHRQAEALAQWAVTRPFTSIACSPMRRAVQTLAPTAKATGLVPVVEPRLREVDFGIAEGRTLAELREVDPQAVARFEADPVTHHFPEGEPPADAVERALAGLAALVAADPGGRILVVAHNTLMRLVTCRVLGVPLGEYRRRLPTLEPAALTSFRFPDGESAPVALLAYNVPLPGAAEPEEDEP